MYNTGAAAVNADLYVVAINEGTATFEAGRCITQIGVVSTEDVINAPTKYLAPSDEVRDVYGGFMHSFKEHLHRHIKRGAGTSGGQLVYAGAKKEDKPSGGAILNQKALKSRLQ